MKTLRQIREECNHIPNTDTLNEATGKKHAEKSAGFPNMPSMLLFKRVTYRIYPNNQLVALYYSRMIDKYLTIPFSKEGVLQMKEGVIHDSLDEGWNLEEETITTKVDCREAFRQKLEEKRMLQNEGIGSAVDSAADAFVPYYSAGKKAIKGDWKGAATDAAVDTALMATTGGVGKLGTGVAKLGLKAAGKAGAKMAARPVERAVTKVGGKGGLKAYRALKKGAVHAATSGSGDGQQKQSEPAKTSKTGEVKLADVKTTSSWKPKQPAPVQENKIANIRRMVKENTESIDLVINGKPITLNTNMAKRIVEVYDSVNSKNKKIVENMLNEDLDSFKKLLNFSIRN